MQPFIIDTDPGIDDALAIMLALRLQLPIAGFASVYGNAGITDTTRNLQTILEIAGSKAPIYLGAERPLTKEPLIATSHGERGFGGLATNLKTPPAGTALKLYRDTLSRGPASIIAIGPLTNLAVFAEMHPELVGNIQEIICMGGVFDEKGNVTAAPLSEFNSFNDPDALQEVLELPVKKVLIPANICRRVMLSESELAAASERVIHPAMRRIIAAYIEYYQRDPEHGGFTGGVLYDVLAAAYAHDPSLLQLEKKRVFVDTSESPTRGITLALPGQPNCRVATGVDAELVKNLLLKA